MIATYTTSYPFTLTFLGACTEYTSGFKVKDLTFDCAALQPKPVVSTAVTPAVEIQAPFFMYCGLRDFPDKLRISKVYEDMGKMAAWLGAYTSPIAVPTLLPQTTAVYKAYLQVQIRHTVKFPCKFQASEHHTFVASNPADLMEKLLKFVNAAFTSLQNDKDIWAPILPYRFSKLIPIAQWFT